MIFVVLEVFHKKKDMKRAAKKETTLPDPRFNDQLVTRFVNNLMWDGKKSTALKFL
jgi:ribosomal protein S7